MMSFEFLTYTILLPSGDICGSETYSMLKISVSSKFDFTWPKTIVVMNNKKSSADFFIFRVLILVVFNVLQDSDYLSKNLKDNLLLEIV